MISHTTISFLSHRCIRISQYEYYSPASSPRSVKSTAFPARRSKTSTAAPAPPPACFAATAVRTSSSETNSEDAGGGLVVSKLIARAEFEKVSIRATAETRASRISSVTPAPNPAVALSHPIGRSVFAAIEFRDAPTASASSPSSHVAKSTARPCHGCRNATVATHAFGASSDKSRLHDHPPNRIPSVGSRFAPGASPPLMLRTNCPSAPGGNTTSAGTE
mmetsp:Transcript_202/g.641  ORF Transcript_202/g.641 Transcript_202/m.641 type:complete len:220 (+) Transcript_202:1001-1660(+)